MENKVCKKCSKSLPNDYEYDCCESCRNASAQKMKRGLIVFSILGAIIAFFASIIKLFKKVKK